MNWCNCKLVAKIEEESRYLSLLCQAICREKEDVISTNNNRKLIMYTRVNLSHNGRGVEDVFSSDSKIEYRWLIIDADSMEFIIKLRSMYNVI